MYLISMGVAASIQMCGSYIPGKLPMWRFILKCPWVLTQDSMVLAFLSMSIYRVARLRKNNNGWFSPIMQKGWICDHIRSPIGVSLHAHGKYYGMVPMGIVNSLNGGHPSSSSKAPSLSSSSSLAMLVQLGANTLCNKMKSYDNIYFTCKDSTYMYTKYCIYSGTL